MGIVFGVIGSLLGIIFVWLILLTRIVIVNHKETFERHINDVFENTDRILDVYSKMNDMEKRINEKIKEIKKGDK